MVESVKLTFPVRGHLYMWCDRDFTLIHKKAPVELPSDWFACFRSARTRPMTYNGITMTHNDFFNFSGLFKPQFKAVCPVPSRPIQELYFKRNAPLNWHGAINSAVLVARGKGKVREPVLVNQRNCTPPHYLSVRQCIKTSRFLKHFALLEIMPLGSAVDNFH
ncbi:hypothetical protein RRG08_039343 [Elysia crispata]|uniref:Uncharacterized protein n=1 Tax=Elysia crispata TaxID=231223 RepID=A0AAE0YQW8_9GAST|nr:hypothetical protein RRG08_039343 [Elysia crispata]